jgi:glucokinase
MGAFVAKGRFEELMNEIPVRVILEPKTSQFGAAYTAAGLLRS